VLYEISFPDGSKVEYKNLASTLWAGLGVLVDKYNEPFKLTPVDSNHFTKYCFPANAGEWIEMHFTRHSTNNTSVPIFCWIKYAMGHKDRIESLQLFQSYFGDLPADLDPSYAL